ALLTEDAPRVAKAGLREGFVVERLRALPVDRRIGDEELIRVMETVDVDLSFYDELLQLVEDARVPLRDHLEHVALHLDVLPPCGVGEEQVEDGLEAFRDDQILDLLGGALG